MSIHLFGLGCALAACGVAWLIIRHERRVIRFLGWLLRMKLRE